MWMLAVSQWRLGQHRGRRRRRAASTSKPRADNNPWDTTDTIYSFSIAIRRTESRCRDIAFSEDPLQTRTWPMGIMQNSRILRPIIGSGTIWLHEPSEECDP